MRWFLTFIATFCISMLSWAAAPTKVLLVGQGPDGHPFGTHEYAPGMDILAALLKDVPNLEILTVRADGPWKEGPELLARVDGVVLFVSEGARWIDADPARRKAFDELAQRGGGVAVLHWAMGTKDADPIDNFLRLAGGCHGGPDRKYQVLPKAQVRVVDPKSPITAGIQDFTAREEFYYRLKFVQPGGSVKPLLQVPIDGQIETVCWSWERSNGGRSFGFSGLHFHDNWTKPEYRRLIAQGTLWTLKLPVPEKGLNVEIDEEVLRLKKRE
ncbi:MAG: ThuA domain-containing protein [Gemmataceae bacterium]